MRVLHAVVISYELYTLSSNHRSISPQDRIQRMIRMWSSLQFALTWMLCDEFLPRTQNRAIIKATFWGGNMVRKGVSFSRLK